MKKTQMRVFLTRAQLIMALMKKDRMPAVLIGVHLLPGVVIMARMLVVLARDEHSDASSSDEGSVASSGSSS